MKKLVKYAFLFWLMFIASIYIFTALKWLKNPFNKSPYDYIFTSIITGTMVSVFLLSTILRKRGYIIPLFLASLSVIAVIVITILSKTIIDLLIFIWILVLGTVISKKFVNFSFKDLPISWLENVILSVAVGFGIFSFLILSLSLLGFLYKELVLFILILFSIIFHKDIILFLKEALVEIKNLPLLFRNASNTGFIFALISIILISFLINFIGTIAPEIQYDALSYHLILPRIYIENHRIVEVPYIHQAYFASTGMLYVLGLILSGQITAKLFSLCFGILITVAIASFGKRFFSLEVGIIAAVLFYVSPLVAWLSTTTYIDLAVVFFSFTALYALTLWWKTNRKGLLLLCGLISGLALSVKLNSALLLTPMGLSVIAINCHLSGKNVFKNLSNLAIFGLSILIVAAPWYLIIYFQKGDSVFSLYNAIFKSIFSQGDPGTNFKDFGIGYGLKNFFWLPWNLTYRSSAYMEGVPDGFIGLTLLIMLPFIFFTSLKSSGIVTVLVLICLGFIGIWFRIGQYLRYMLPILPLLSILAAYSLSYFFNKNHHRFIKHIYSIVLMSCLICTISISLISFWNIPERIPYKVALGIESQENYLSRVIRNYRAASYLNKNYDYNKIRVLLIGTHHCFYLKAPAENLPSSPRMTNLLKINTNTELSTYLKEKGITHILIDTFAAQILYSDVLKIINQEFLKTKARLEFSSNYVEIYKLLGDEYS
jgi:4-amino-4-deoxy-L-arabinose transferase-like glycosyltransferase